MAEHQFPRRMFSEGSEPIPGKSIHCFSHKRLLIEALREALYQDEWDELLESNFGVFLKWHELNFTWCSRMVHYMLTAQLVCKKKYEIWSLVGVQPARFSLNEFEQITGLNCAYAVDLKHPPVVITDGMITLWELLGVNPEVGPSYVQLQEACGRCQGDGWERRHRIWLGYLSIYVSFIEAQHWTSSSSAAHARLLLVPGSLETYPWGRWAFKLLIDSVKEANEKLIMDQNYQIEGFCEVLNVWIYWAVPGMATIYGDPLPNNPTPPLLAYNGSRNRKKLEANLHSQTRVRSFVSKEVFDELFPVWDNDAEDKAIDNIVRAMTGQLGTQARANRC